MVSQQRKRTNKSKPIWAIWATWSGSILERGGTGRARGTLKQNLGLIKERGTSERSDKLISLSRGFFDFLSSFRVLPGFDLRLLVTSPIYF